MLHFAFLLLLVIQSPTVISIPKHLNENLKCIPCTVMTCVTWSSSHVQLQFPNYLTIQFLSSTPHSKIMRPLHWILSALLLHLFLPCLNICLLNKQPFSAFQYLDSLSLHLTNLSYNTVAFLICFSMLFNVNISINISHLCLLYVITQK